MTFLYDKVSYIFNKRNMYIYKLYILKKANKLYPSLPRNTVPQKFTSRSSGYRSNTSDIKITHGAVSLAALSFRYFT